MNANDLEIHPNTTIRQEYVKYGNPDCQILHGPYLYAYWKHDKKLNKRYVGKNLEDFGLRKIAKEMKVRPSQLVKLKLYRGPCRNTIVPWVLQLFFFFRPETYVFY